MHREWKASSVGQEGFIQRHGLWDETQHSAAEQAIRTMEERGIELIRLSWPDQHGLLRGKTLTAESLGLALRNGYTLPNTLLLKDTSGKTVYPIFREGAGLGMPELALGRDLILVPDMTTFRILPWAANTAWVLCDVYHPDGRPVLFCTRRVLRDILGEFANRGYDYVVGLEVEFHVFRLNDAFLHLERSGWPADPPTVDLLSHGFQYMAEVRIDQLDPVVQLLREGLSALNLPIRSFELELGPGQLEVTFGPQAALEAADNMSLFRSAVKQLCRRNGYHATFMCRPGLPNVFSSGWHLHQSLWDRATGGNAFMSQSGEGDLSPLGRHFLGGLLEHARGAAVFTTPTINGYKRFQPYALAPDRCVWGMGNKGALIRVAGGPGDPATRFENRSGEPTANPYLYMASQLVSGLDGIDRELDPGPPTEEPYDAEAVRLPTSLAEALDALSEDKAFAKWFGTELVDHLITLKRAEVKRFNDTVTDWEQREYFEMY